MTPPENGVMITTEQIYALGLSTQQAVQQLSADLKPVVAAVADHEARLRALERGRWPLPALGAVAGVVGAVAGLWAALAGH